MTYLKKNWNLPSTLIRSKCKCVFFFFKTIFYKVFKIYKTDHERCPSFLVHIIHRKTSLRPSFILSWRVFSFTFKEKWRISLIKSPNITFEYRNDVNNRCLLKLSIPERNDFISIIILLVSDYKIQNRSQTIFLKQCSKIIFF